MKQHDKGTGNGSMSKNAPEKPSAEKPSPENLVSILYLDHSSDFTYFLVALSYGLSV